MFEIEHDNAEFLVCRLSGKLTTSDYDAMVPELENAMQLRPGPVRLLIVLEDFRGWELGALWKDLKFGINHRKDFDRIAVVGQSKVQEWGAWLSRPFLRAKMRFYDIGKRELAEAWLAQSVRTTESAGLDRS